MDYSVHFGTAKEFGLRRRSSSSIPYTTTNAGKDSQLSKSLCRSFLNIYKRESKISKFCYISINKNTLNDKALKGMETFINISRQTTTDIIKSVQVSNKMLLIQSILGVLAGDHRQ